VVSPRSLIFNKSGLVTLTKAKPVSWKYHPHKKISGVKLLEKFADKGFLRVKLEIEGEEYFVINTHIYQSEDELKQKIKFEQTEGVLNYVKAHNPTILTGDFNMKPKELPKLIKSFVRDQKFVSTYLAENKYTFRAFNQIMNWRGIYNDTPDYVFLHSRAKGASVKTQVIAKPVVSDHYPILAEITV
jgi:endonuclease/exonuclease/phosphatase family metal-dependent hydrolase